MKNNSLDFGTIYLKVTPNCNLSCSHCYAHKLQREIRICLDKNFYEFTNQFEHLNIVLHGGEPLYFGADYIIKLIESLNNNLKDKINDLSITTNLITSKEELKKLSQYFNSIGTSWNSGKVRFSNDKILKVWEDNIKYWKKIKKDITVNVTLTEDLVSYSNEQIIDLIKYFDSLSIDFINLEFLYTNKPYSDLFKDNINKFLTNWYNNYKELKPNFKDVLLLSIQESKQGLRSGIFCHNCIKTTWSVDAFGSITGCPNDEDLILGKLSNPESYKLSNLLQARKSEKICDLSLLNQCLHCKNFSWCSGGCMKVNKFGCVYPKDLFQELV